MTTGTHTTKFAFRSVQCALLCTVILLLSSCAPFKILRTLEQAKVTRLNQKHFAQRVIPFRLVGDKMVITVHISAPVSADADFVLDTGAPTILTKDFADRYHIPYSLTPGARFVTPGGSNSNAMPKFNFARNVSMDFNGVTVTKPHLLVGTIGSSAFACDHIDGMIGSDLLSQFGFYVDFQKKQIVLYDKKEQPAAMLDSFPYRIDFKPFLIMHNPFVKMSVHDSVYKFVWDLGYNGNIFIQYNQDAKADMEKHINSLPHKTDVETYGAIEDANGVVAIAATSYFVQTDTVVSGCLHMPVHPSYTVYSYNSGVDDNVHANIGVGFMKQFDMFISWKDRKIYLRPNKQELDAAKLPVAAIRYEASDSSAYVVAVNTTHTLYGKGLRPGDRITSLDGQNVAALLSAAKADKCTASKALTQALLHSKKIIVQQKDKSVREINLP